MTIPLQDFVTLTGRLLLAGLLILGALQKFTDPAPATALLLDWGWPAFLLWPAGIFNAVAGGLIALGLFARSAALAAAAYCALTSLFHFLPDDPWQMTIFVKNWALAGGYLMLAAQGPGRYALRP